MSGAVSISASQLPYFGGPWFMSPFFERELAERGLDPETEAMVREFSERGYRSRATSSAGGSSASRVIDVGTGEPLPLETENGPISLPMSDRLARLKIRRRRHDGPECRRFVI